MECCFRAEKHAAAAPSTGNYRAAQQHLEEESRLHWYLDVQSCSVATPATDRSLFGLPVAEKLLDELQFAVIFPEMRSRQIPNRNAPAVAAKAAESLDSDSYPVDWDFFGAPLID